MKIMEIVSGPGVNGAIIHCLLLTRELLQRGHQVVLVCRPNAWIATQLADTSVEIVTSNLQRWPADELQRIARLAVARGIDVIHTHQSRAHFFGVLLRWLARIPSVATAQSRFLQLHWMLNDHVIAVSEATARFHRRVNLVRASRMSVIPNFVDDQVFSPPSEPFQQAMRAELGIAPQDLVVGQVGGVIRRKGAIYLVRAIAQVQARVPHLRLLLAGAHPEADYLAELRTEADRLGVADKILWLGARSDVPRVLAALDLFALASLEESLPLSTLEAMAAGLPCVTTTAGGMRECLIPGKTGALVKPGDSNALAAALLPLLESHNLRQRFGEAGREHVERLFSARAVVPRIEQVLEQVAEQKRGSRRTAA